MQQHINFKRERRLGDKLNATFAFVSQNIRPLVKNVLLVAGPFALVAGLCFGLYQTYVIGAIGNQNADASAGFYVMIAVVALLMIVTMMYSSTMVVAIVQRMMREYVEKGSANLCPAYFWANIWGEFFSVLGSTFGIAVLMCVLLAIIITPLVLLAQGLNAPALAVLMVFLAGLAVLLVGAAMMLIFPIRNFERKNFFEALGRALELNAGKWLSSAGLMLIVYILQSVIAGGAMIPLYAIMIVRMLHAQSAESLIVEEGGFGLYEILGALSGAFYVLVFTLASSLLFISITFQYFSLRENKEASGLLERMESFGVAQTVHEEEEQY